MIGLGEQIEKGSQGDVKDFTYPDSEDDEYSKEEDDAYYIAP